MHTETLPPLSLQPIIQTWFQQTIGTPAVMQLQAWQSIAAGQHTLVAAPTGAGKTLAAFVPLFDQLLTPGGLKLDTTRILYVSPLKALSHDVERNLQPALNSISQHAGLSLPLTAAVRTGDTAASERLQQVKQPPHILVTTPESLFILLCSPNGRKALAGIRYVVVDELHALAENKRGVHLLLSLERLQKLVSRPLQRIGLSATQKPLPTLANWLCGGHDCSIVNAGLRTDLDLDIELPSTPLSSLLSNIQLEELCARILSLAQSRRTTLVFVNTRRMTEKLARMLTERMGEHADKRVLATHHGSLSRELRLDAEQRLKNGQLQIVIATSSLELGIDIGSIDLVCQLGSPKRFSAMLQRAGRAGHYQGGTPIARLFPLTRDDLLECWVLLQGIRQQQLDCVRMPGECLDVLAQHILAECANSEQSEALVSDWVRRAWPYRHLSDATLADVLQMLADGFNGRQEQLRLLWDKSRGRLKVVGPNARHLCAMNAGAIPDQFDQDVWLLPDGEHIGTVDEDFAFESMAGDVLQLGNRSLQIVKASAEGLFVQLADDYPPAIPFWLGEGAGRSAELSTAVIDLLHQASQLQAEQLLQSEWLQKSSGLNQRAAQQLTTYLAASHAALNGLPNTSHIIIERFFDSTGNYHIVIHSHYGIRVNRAWGLALRKRFCRQFNFELQASATDNGVLLSLGPTHSFPLEDIIGYLHSHSVRQILIQAMLDSPLFVNRWRWAANTALAVLRMRNGRKVAPQHQRTQAEDLLALLFPDQLACLENIRGEREIPEHPLVKQVIDDCLFEAMDIEGLEALLIAIEQHEVKVSCLDLNGPSPLAEELVNGKPWSFLDDGEAEERRTRTVQTTPKTPTIDSAVKLRELPDAQINRLRQQSWPVAQNPEQLYQLLYQAGFITLTEAQHGAPKGINNPNMHLWGSWFKSLTRELRASVLYRAGQPCFWAVDQRIAELMAMDDQLSCQPELPDYALTNKVLDTEQALQCLLSARLQVMGMALIDDLCELFKLTSNTILAGLLRLENTGAVVRIRHQQQEFWLLRQHAFTLRQHAIQS